MKRQAIASVHATGSGYSPLRTLNGHDSSILRLAIEHGVVSGARTALVFVAVVVGLGAALSLLIPGDTSRVSKRSLVPDPEANAVRAIEPVPAMIGGDA